MQKIIETGIQRVLIGITILIIQSLILNVLKKLKIMLKMDQKEKAQSTLTGGRE
jgi:hypothetical protein